MFKLNQTIALVLSVSSALIASQSAFACMDPGVKITQDGMNLFGQELRVSYRGFSLGANYFYYDHEKSCWSFTPIGGTDAKCTTGAISLNLATVTIRGKKATIEGRGTKPVVVTLTAGKQTSGKAEYHSVEAEYKGKSLLVRNDLNGPQPRGLPDSPRIEEADLAKGSFRRTGSCGARLEKASFSLDEQGGAAAPNSSRKAD